MKDGLVTTETPIKAQAERSSSHTTTTRASRPHLPPPPPPTTTTATGAVAAAVAATAAVADAAVDRVNYSTFLPLDRRLPPFAAVFPATIAALSSCMPVRSKTD